MDIENLKRVQTYPVKKVNKLLLYLWFVLLFSLTMKREREEKRN
jgi:hypothetical protein